MSLYDHDVIDIVSKDKGSIFLDIVAWKKWGPEERLALMAKLRNYMRYAGSKEFRKKHGEGKVTIVISTVHPLPQKDRQMIEDIRKEFDNKYKVQVKMSKAA